MLFLFSSDLQQKKLFINLDLFIISLLIYFVKKGAWFTLVYFFFVGSFIVYHLFTCIKKTSQVSSKIPLLGISWFIQCEINHLKIFCNFDSWLLCFLKSILRTATVNLWKSESPAFFINFLRSYKLQKSFKFESVMSELKFPNNMNFP